MKTLKIKKVGIDTYQENIAYMPLNCEICKSQGFVALSKIEIHTHGRSILATLNMTENGLVGLDEIGLSNIAFERLGLKAGDEVWLSHPNPLLSTDSIRAKLEGRSLGRREFFEIIEDILSHRYSNIELTAFVIACAQQKLSEEEITYLTEAMIETGHTIDWGLDLVLDKHSIGGVPGNRTTMIVVPIVAAFGLPIPKTSSRAITSPSGTADTMETVAEVRLSLEKMREIVAAEGACIAWGGSLFLAPADDILISVERPLNIDAEGQMIASILSKKKAAGSTHILIDIPVGPTAKVRSARDAKRLEKLFEQVGKHLRLKTRVVITDGSQPIGRGIGPALEARDVLQVLKGDSRAPVDLREKAIFLAGELLELSRKVKPGHGQDQAREILDSGEALRKFERLVESQGRKHLPGVAAYRHEIRSVNDGQIQSIHNLKIAKAAKLAGAPQDPSAGVDLEVKIGQKVRAGDLLFTLHAESREELSFAVDYVEANPDILVLKS